MTAGGDEDHVFDAAAAEGGGVESGFHGEEFVFENLAAAVVEEDGLVDFEANAVSGAVAHERKGGVVFGVAADQGESVFFKNGGGGEMHRFTGCAGFECEASGGFSLANGRVHFESFVGRGTVDDGAGHVAIVAGGVVHGEDVNDGGESGFERAGAVVVAVGDVRCGGDDGAVRVRVVPLEEKGGDHGAEPLGSENGSFVMEDAFRVRSGVCDGPTGVGHGFAGDFLGVAKVLDFFGIFDATIEDAKVGGVVDGDAGFLNEVYIKVGKRAVDRDGGLPGLTETLGRGLGEGGVPVAGEAAIGRKVGGAGDAIGADGFAGAVHLDIADKVGRGAIGEVDRDRGVANKEAAAMEEGGVGGGVTGEDGGSFGCHVAEENAGILNDGPGRSNFEWKLLAVLWD